MITGEPVQGRIPFHVGPLSPSVYAAATASASAGGHPTVWHAGGLRATLSSSARDNIADGSSEPILETVQSVRPAVAELAGDKCALAGRETAVRRGRMMG